MCVVVVKPKGIEMPTYATLMDCWQQNPDGAGFMYADGSSVRIEKGFMTWKEFRSRLEKLEKKIDLEAATVVFHFRIATHGEVSRECCHPFPLSSELTDLRKCKAKARIGVAHNGVIQGRNTSKVKSDTMDYIMQVIAPMYGELGDAFMDSKHMRKVIEGTVNGSRLVFLKPNGDYTLIGSWSMEDGCYYSNLLHKTMADCWFWYDTEDYKEVGMDNPPSDMCEHLCDDYPLCTMAREWYCISESEALEVIEECLMRDEMENVWKMEV